MAKPDSEHLPAAPNEAAYTWQYRPLGPDSPEVAVSAAEVDALTALGFVPLGRYGSRVPLSPRTQLVNEVFAHPTDGTYATLLRAPSDGFEVLTLYTLLQDGGLVTTERTKSGGWLRYGPGAQLGRDANYVQQFVHGATPARQLELHARRVRQATARRGTSVRTDCSLAALLAARTARARARAGWTVGETRLIPGVMRALGVLGLAVLGATAWSVSRLPAGPAGAHVALGAVLLVAGWLYFGSLLKLAMRWGAPLTLWALRRGRMRRDTDIAAVEAEHRKSPLTPWPGPPGRGSAARRFPLLEVLEQTFRAVPEPGAAPWIPPQLRADLSALGFARLGRMVDQPPGSYLDQSIHEVFALQGKGTFAALWRMPEGGAALALYTVLQDGAVVATRQASPRAWLRRGLAHSFGTDPNWFPADVDAPPAELLRRHDARAARVAQRRGKGPREDASLEQYVCLQIARARARRGWEEQLAWLSGTTCGVVVLASWVLPLGWLLAADHGRTWSPAWFLHLLGPILLWLFLSRLALPLAFHWIAPLAQLALTGGKQAEATEVTRVELQRALRGAGTAPRDS